MSTVLKCVFVLAWVLLCASLVILFFLSEYWPGGFLPAVGHAEIVFVVGVLVALGGLFVGATWQRGKMSVAWLASGGLQVLASVLVGLILFFGARAS